MTVKNNSIKDIDSVKNELLKEFEFFCEKKQTILARINSNIRGVQTTYHLIENLFKQDLNEVDILVNIDVEIEKLNCHIALSYLNEVEGHNVTFQYLTRLPSMLFKLNANKLKILNKLTVEGEECQIFHISPDIGLLTNLIEIDLTDCMLHKLPDAIVHLEKLEIIILKGNRIKNLPEGIEKLNLLRELDLSHNPELCELPKNISKLKNLTTLIIDHDDLAILPEELCELIHLHEIRAHHNRLNSLPKGFDRLSSLEVLDLHNNEIKRLPRGLSRMTSLRYLNVQGNKVNSLPNALKKIAVK